MFDKLKRKFILINMGLLTTVFIGIFGAIYIMTSINLDNEMYRSLEGALRGGKPGVMKQPMMYGNIIVELNVDGEIINAISVPEVEESTITELVKEVMYSGSENGKIKVEGISYGYIKQGVIDNKYSQSISQENNISYKIALYDRSNQIAVMIGLLETFVAVCAASLILLLIISIYLTNKTIKPIKEAFEKQKQFLADASHELRTPLTIIKTNTSLLLSNKEDTIQNQGKWINYITFQADRMSQLVNEMLSLAKMDIAETSVNLVTLNISKIIDSMTLGFEAVLFENDIELHSNIMKDIYINGDSESIKKLFSIIMDNAIKHTRKKGKISISLISERSKVKLKINNTGAGIEAEHIEKIFERFYRVDTSRDRETGGYGLGLSIAKSIVEQHKGKIYAESNLGIDTTFIVELPLQSQ